MGKHRCLTEAAEAIAGNVVAEIMEELAQRLAEAGLPAARPQRFQHAQRFLMQIFRQVGDGRANFVMHRMALLVGRAAHGDEVEVETCSFQSQQFLCDECFGEARIAFQQHHDFLFCGHVVVPSFLWRNRPLRNAA